jgi:hypothetical protein
MSQLVCTAVYSFANVQKQLEHLLLELDVEVKHRAVVRASLSATNTKASTLAPVPQNKQRALCAHPTSLQHFSQVCFFHLQPMQLPMSRRQSQQFKSTCRCQTKTW